MSSALSDPKLDNDKAEENVKVSTSQTQPPANLMSNSPPPDDNYLETLSRFGITVTCKAKKTINTPEKIPQPEKTEETNSHLQQLLNNSSITFTKPIPKLTPKPASPPPVSQAATQNSDEEDDDPLSKLSLLGVGVSIKRKSSADSNSKPLLEQNLEKLKEASEPVKRKFSADSIGSEESLSSSVSIQRRKRISSESVPNIPEDLPSSISITPKKKESREKELPVVSSPETEAIPKTTLVGTTPKTKPVEATPKTTPVEATPKSTPTESSSKTTPIEDNEQPSTSRASSRSSKYRRASASNTIFNWLDYESPSSRCNSADSQSSLTPSELRDLENQVDSDYSDTAPKKKRRGRPPCGRGRGASRRKRSPVKRGKKYEYDEDFRSGTKVTPTTKRQTRGVKISVNNYSESDESDFERYINEESSEASLGKLGGGSELTEQQELEKLLLEQEIKKELLDEQAELLNELEKADFGDEIAGDEEHVDEEEDDAINDGDLEDDLDQLLLEEEEEEDEEDPDEESDKPVEKPINEEKPAGSAKTTGISILKNEDYSEVLKTQPGTQQSTVESKEKDPKDEKSVLSDSEKQLEDSDFDDCDIGLHLADNRSYRSETPGEASDCTSEASTRTTDTPSQKRRRSAVPTEISQELKYPSDNLFCWHCKRNFSKKKLFWRHISTHVRLPTVYLTRVSKEEIDQHCGVGYEYIPPELRMASLKLTLKTNNNHQFEIINKPETEPFSSATSESGGGMEEDSGMELDDALGSDNMELDNMELEDNTNLANNDQASDSGNGSEQTESIAGSEADKEIDDKADVERELAKQAEQAESPTAVSSSTAAEQTYIPGVRIRSLESVQKLDIESNPAVTSATTSTSNSPTLRVRTNLTSPQSNFLGTQPNLYTEQQQQPQQQPYPQHPHQQAYNQHAAWQGGQYNPQQPMGPPVYQQQNMQQYSNNGNSYYQSYNQTTYVQNDSFNPTTPSYWTNSGNIPIPGPAQTGINESSDPLAMAAEDDPLKTSQTSGEKEQEQHGNLLKSFLDGTTTSPNVSQMGGDNSTLGEFMPLDRLVSTTTCSVCSERFADAAALEEHKRVLNHYAPPTPPTTSPSSALQPIGSQALQTLANAHTGLPIQHQIRVQHNVIVNNVIQQGAMPPIPPYPPQVDNSMQQLAQQVNRMPPPGTQYPGYNQQGQFQQNQQPYRHPGVPPGAPQQYPQNPGYNQQQPYQYPNNQVMGALPAPPTPPQTTSPSQQFQQNQGPRPGIRPGMTPPGLPQNVRPRGQAYLPTTQAGPPPPHGMRGPVRGQYRPGPMSRTRPQMGPRLQGPNARPGGPGMNQATRMRRPPAPQNQDPKRKRVDVLLPDRHEDPDCHVIAVQQRNENLVIQNVQGNASCDSTQEALNKAKEMIQLTDSITLSVRGKDGQTIVPQQEPKLPPNPVADILATRGITVTPAAKSNGSTQSKLSNNDNNAVAINLNNAVTLIPATKSAPRATTVDLTDEPTVGSLTRPNKPYKCSICPKQFNSQELYTQHVIKHRTLPYRCNSCNAAYPKQLDLINHQKTCRVANANPPAASTFPSSASDLGLPVVDLRKPQVLANLTRLGIQHYIPLARGNTSGVFGLPVVSVEGARNPNIINLGALGSSNVLPLGPVRSIPVQNSNPPRS